jgi:uncharacterized radical SAM superfamily Fe-S cluster-containing enzyme
MARKADILLFQNFNEEQLKRLISQLSHIREYDILLDYVYDGKPKLKDNFFIGENILVDLDSVYYSQIKKDIKETILPNNQILGKIIDPLFIKENYFLVEITTPKRKFISEIYCGNLCKINII